MTLSIEELSKTFGTRRARTDSALVRALEDVSLQAADGELLVIVGPSGSGKSTLLRCVCGLETIDRGRISVQGKDVTRLPPAERNVAMVFQEFALFPHLNVRANISFGLEARKQETTAIAAKVEQAAEMLDLKRLLNRYPSSLSGGEKQRVALARAVVREPAAFLLDEPLSNLDAELRTHMRAEIKTLQRRLETTTLYVTHDQVEALTMGDRVAVLRAGRIEQIGPPMELYDHPANGFVARFLGSPPMNLFPSGIHKGPAGAGVVGIRPERIRLVEPSEGRLAGSVVLVEPIGTDAIVHVDVQGHRLLVRVERSALDGASGEVGLLFLESDVHGFQDWDGPAL
ncbi:MAG TPA: ABC transporter ATP-binding protein [Actinomycetota bacterium]|nr:ABC transporter ATP-binding protein [Actinomycetota bacterium]